MALRVKATGETNGRRRARAITVRAGLMSIPVEDNPRLMQAAVVVPEPLQGSRIFVASFRWVATTACTKASLNPA